MADTDICYPFLKFSYATGVRSDNTIPWTHLTADNIFVVVNGTEHQEGGSAKSLTQSSNGTNAQNRTLIRDDALTMRVFQGTTVLVNSPRIPLCSLLTFPVSTSLRLHRATVAYVICTQQESLNVGQYIDRAVDARRKSAEAGVTVKVEQLPIFGITKENLLAIRYRLESGEVSHRFSHTPLFAATLLRCLRHIKGFIQRMV